MNTWFKLRNNLGSLYAMVMLGRRPDQVKYVFMIGDRQDNLAEEARTSGQIRDPYADRDLEALWRERHHPAVYRIEDLAQLPPATLGSTYARFMLARRLRPDFYKDVVPKHKMHYLRLRLRQTHDVWHVLSGFDTDEFGEVGLQGFYFAQFTNGQSALIFAAAILKSIVRARFGDIERFVADFCEGYRNGAAAKSLLGVRWENFWHSTVDELRQRFDITPARRVLAIERV